MLNLLNLLCCATTAMALNVVLVRLVICAFFNWIGSNVVISEAKLVKALSNLCWALHPKERKLQENMITALRSLALSVDNVSRICRETRRTSSWRLPYFSSLITAGNCVNRISSSKWSGSFSLGILNAKWYNVFWTQGNGAIFQWFRTNFSEWVIVISFRKLIVFQYTFNLTFWILFIVHFQLHSDFCIRFQCIQFSKRNCEGLSICSKSGVR